MRVEQKFIRYDELFNLLPQNRKTVSYVSYLNVFAPISSSTQRLEDLQNEAMRAVLGCTRDKSLEAIRYLLGFPTMADRHRIAQVKAVLRVSTDKDHPLHTKIGHRPSSKLKKIKDPSG